MTAGAHVIVSTPAGARAAKCIKIWRRADGQQMRMSTSSGPKDTVGNDALSCFDRLPECTEVALMLMAGALREGSILFLLHVRGQWCDMRGVVPRIEADAELRAADAERVMKLCQGGGI